MFFAPNDPIRPKSPSNVRDAARNSPGGPERFTPSQQDIYIALMSVLARGEHAFGSITTFDHEVLHDNE